MNTHSAIQSAYFLNREKAIDFGHRLLTQQVNDAEFPPMVYYDGEPLEQEPFNLLCVPKEKFSDFFVETSLPLPLSFFDQQGNPANGELATVFQEMIAQVQAFREEVAENCNGKPSQDTYFTDPKVAYLTALQRNRVQLNHPIIDGTQLCFYDGEPFENAPDNLINVPAENVLPYFVTMRYRIPVTCYFPIWADEIAREEFKNTFSSLLQEVHRQRNLVTNGLVHSCLQLKPSFMPNQPLRFFFVTSRLTEVLQYSAKGIAKAMKRLGHESCLVIEQNDMEDLGAPTVLAEYLDFKPHAVVNINHINNGWLNPDVFNFIWWQDPMPALVNDGPMQLRERDITMSAYRRFDDFLAKKNIHDVLRQGCCIDDQIFRVDQRAARQAKAVFIGSSYYPRIKNATAAELAVVSELSEMLENGIPLTKQAVESVSNKHRVSFLHSWLNLTNYVVRDTTVKWLCSNTDMEVEIYGRHWDYSPEVRPFYKGELPHGKAVAEVYNQAEYALVSLPEEVNSQRLAEAAACGCIPLVFDTRHHAEPPFWDNQCLFFKTREELMAAIGQRPVNSPTAIAEANTYTSLARKLVEIVSDRSGIDFTAPLLKYAAK